MMIQHIQRGLEENLLEENSKLLQMKGDFPYFGLVTLSRGKLIVKHGSNVMIPSQARKCILKEVHSTHDEEHIPWQVFLGKDQRGC